MRIETESKEKAVCVLKRLSADEITKLEYDAREKARLDHENMIQGSFDMGKAEGKAEGRIEGKIEGKIEAVIAVICNFHVGLEQAMRTLNISTEHKQEIIDILHEKKIEFDE